jgi:hypothetical protein
MSNNQFPLHNQQGQVHHMPGGIGAPPEIPLLKKQSEDRTSLYRNIQQGLIQGVDITIQRVNAVLPKLQGNPAESLKLQKYMQRCIDHKMMILQAMEILANEDMRMQKFLNFWLEGKELPPLPGQQQQQQRQVDPNLPLNAEGKPVGTMRADGVVDISTKSTTIPVNGVLTPEQAAALEVNGPVGPKAVVPTVSNGGVMTPEQMRDYVKTEEAKTKVPAVNVGGNGTPTV